MIDPEHSYDDNTIVEVIEQDILEENVDIIEPEQQISDREKDLEEIFEALKDKIKSLDNNDPLRIQILTCAPESWSINKIRKEFNVSKRASRKAKALRREKGIWPVIEKKICARMPESLKNDVLSFYKDNFNSKILPGKKDVISVKIDGKRKMEQKRLILYSLRELYNLFRKSHPNSKISFSFFCKLRPKEVVLPGASGTHIVCVCTIHQNIILMIEAIADLLNSDGSDEKPKNYSDFMKMILCENPGRDCHLSTCDECPEEYVVSNYVIEILETAGITSVEYAHWTSVDRTTMLNVTANVEEFSSEFGIALSKLKSHSFITKKQNEFKSSLKESLPTKKILVMFDFTQNYVYVAQDVAQAFYYNNTQCIVFPVIYYYKKDGILEHQTCVFLSDSTRHDSAFVYAVLSILLPKIKARVKNVKEIVYFTDGAKQHFKNRYQIDLLRHHKDDFGLEAEWHFNTTAHGRDEYDGVGGKFKYEAYKHSLQARPKDAILAFDKLVKWGQSHFTNIEVYRVDKSFHEQTTRRLARRFNEAPAVPGISKNHSFTLENNLVIMKRYSSDEVSESVL